MSLIILYWSEIISVKQDLKDEKKRQDFSQKGDFKAKGQNWMTISEDDNFWAKKLEKQ